MSERDVILLLEDMLDLTLKIRQYTKGYNLESFVSESKTIDAVTLNFEII